MACRGWFDFRPGLRRASTIAGPVAMALALLLPAFSGCNCPEPRFASDIAPVPDSPEHVRNVQVTISNAQAKGVWTVDDERTFSRNMSHMSAETRFAYGVQIATLINTKAMIVDRTPPKTKPPARCPCGTCSGTSTPAAPATPDTTGGRPTDAQPGTPPSAQPGTTAPASPTAKQPQSPKRAQ